MLEEQKDLAASPSAIEWALIFLEYWADKIQEGIIMLLVVGVLGVVILGGGCAIAQIFSTDPTLYFYWRIAGQRVILGSIVCCWVPFLVYVPGTCVIVGLFHLSTKLRNHIGKSVIINATSETILLILSLALWPLSVAATAVAVGYIDPATAHAVVYTSCIVIVTSGFYALARLRGAQPAFV